MNGMNDEEAREMRAKYPALLAEARAILFEATEDMDRHAMSCSAYDFWKHNRMCPPSHPVWKHSPACNCWVARGKEFLKKSNIN